MGYQNENELDLYLSEIVRWLWEVALFSPVIVSVLLILVYVEYRKKYQWTLGLFLVCTIIGGVIGVVGTFILMVLTPLYSNSPQMPLVAIFGFGPPLIAACELAGFWLFTWVVARKRKRVREEV